MNRRKNRRRRNGVEKRKGKKEKGINRARTGAAGGIVKGPASRLAELVKMTHVVKR